MRKIRLHLAITAGLSVLCGASFAADMPVKAPVLAAVATPSWTGFYAGANLGYGWGDRSPTITATEPGTTAFIKAILSGSGSINPAPFNTSGVFGGLQVGYNYQFAPRWLVGVEVDFQWSDLNGSSNGAFSFIRGAAPHTSSANERINSFGTVRGRLGYLVTPNWLVYGTGGFAYGGVEQQATVTNVSPIGVVNSSFTCVSNAVCATGARFETQGGWAAGAGWEFLLSGTPFFNRPVTMKVEYLYVNLGNNNLLIPTQNNPTVSFATQFGDAAFHTVRAGFNVKF